MVKSEIKENVYKPKYPRLMKALDNSIVLFHSNGKGTTVWSSPNSANKFGAYFDAYDMSVYEDFHGEITLSNVE